MGGQKHISIGEEESNVKDGVHVIPMNEKQYRKEHNGRGGECLP